MALDDFFVFIVIIFVWWFGFAYGCVSRKWWVVCDRYLDGDARKEVVVYGMRDEGVSSKVSNVSFYS